MLIAGKVHPVRCGIRPINSRAAIVGGREAVPHSWPWQCAILFNHGRNFLCGCSIVSPDWVITATHCKYVSVCVPPSHVTLLCGGVRGVGLIGFLLQLNISIVTLSVIGVGVRLAVCLKGTKIEKSLFGGYVISTLPKLKQMLERLQIDLRAKFGPLSAL